ncbi:FeoA family protein [Hoylesella saccharolytica]|uniref:FeoA family protein n=1 Tax=Hoylesella saccharolytica TaxID=633701 RepID=UPI0028F0BC74|nr:FeoA family protein [Hoylesella saccharolytica]
MLTLTQAEEGREYTVKDVKGDARFISRITSIGLTTGAMLKVVRNVKRLPLLIYSRDTMLAINKREANNIYVEVNDR